MQGAWWNNGERRWRPSRGWSRGDVVDAISTLLLGASLCVSLVVFTAYRLSARDWWPSVHGLSEDGAYYLSLSRAGLRVHDVASGKEVDRLTLRAPWEVLGGPVDPELDFFHSLEFAAPEGFEQDPSQFKPELRAAELRPRVMLSPSRRYLAALFPAGYVMLWDRKTDRFKLFAEPEYFFEHFSFDEKRGVLFIETLQRPTQRVQFQGDDSSSEELSSDDDPFAVEIISYRLADLSRSGVEKISHAGKRIGANRNLRMIDDVKKGELRIMQCDDFPFGSQNVIHRVSREDLREMQRRCGLPNDEYSSNDPFGPSIQGLADIQCRMVDDRLYLILEDGRAIHFCSMPGKDPLIRSIRLPNNGWEQHRWFANGCATWDSYSDCEVAVWDEDLGVAIFEVPSSNCCEGVELRGSDSTRQVRIAGSAGEVIDFPIGSDGPVQKRQMDLTAHAQLPWVMTAFVAGIGLLWIVWASATKRLLSKHGWQALLLLSLWPTSFWVIEFLMSDGPRGFLLQSLAWLLFGTLATITGLGMLAKQGAWRSMVICGCALFAMLILSEVPSRFQAPYRQPQPSGFVSFGCYGGPGFVAGPTSGTTTGTPLGAPP